ncbi:MAG: lipopolysaccharide transport system ATP-binding protein [Acidimicrobiaceae bacterium]
MTEREEGARADLAVELVGVSKRYDRLEERAMLLKSILPFTRPKHSELWALRDVSLRVDTGETVGILGHNGAGKTTMLRLLAGVTQPTIGRVRTAGRVAPLIGVGVGFHPEMSGRENVLVNGMLLGLSREEVNERFDDILAFSELEEFVDTPVKFYSSGMFLRLGFAVAVHVDPKVLLIDEVLAVGDYAFQIKCFDRMRALQAAGATIVIVSHSHHSVRLLCPRAIVMAHGQVQFDGAATAAIACYHELLATEAAARRESSGGADVQLLRQELLGPSGPVSASEQHTELRMRATFRCDRAVDSPLAFFTVTSDEGVVAYHLIPRIGWGYRRFEAGDTFEVEARFVAHLEGGTYHLRITLYDNLARDVLFEDSYGLPLYVATRLGAVGLAALDGVVTVDGQDITEHPERTLDGSPIAAPVVEH